MKICLISSIYPPRIGGPSTQTLSEKVNFPVVLKLNKMPRIAAIKRAIE